MERKRRPRLKLKYERERRGWTVEYVATQINCPDPHMIGRWERGKISPCPRYRQALCELFEKDAEELELLPKEAAENNEQAPEQFVPEPGEEPSITRTRSSFFFRQGKGTD
jgi:transcriptional regulator with XRE-family HTH domain